MASIHIRGHIREIELLQGIRNATTVGLLRLSAPGDVQIGDHVGKRVGLNDHRHADVGVLLDLLPDPVDVADVLFGAAIVEVELSIGGFRSAVTVGQVVDDDCGDVWWILASVVGVLDALEVRADIWDFGDDVADYGLARPMEKNPMHIHPEVSSNVLH